MSATTTFAQVQYARLLELEVAHAYYDQGYCPHLSLEPTPETAQLLRGYRLLYKPTPLGGTIVGANPALVDLPAAPEELVLDFQLRMRDTEVLAVTALETAGGQGVYFYEYTSGAWSPMSGHRTPMPAPVGVLAIVRVHALLTASATPRVRLELAVPEVTWQYYLVTGPDYAAALQIAESGRVISSAIPASSQELALVQGRYPGKKITTIGVRLLLKRDLPPWYLVVEGAHAGASHVPDVPPLPKPRPGAAPHLILDYSAILK
jgi:hypothetical protein